MNIILAGIIGRHPYGGVAWCSVHYLLGLQKLGHDVWYLEDTGECNYDPVEKTIALEPTYATKFIDSCLSQFGFGDRWCYVDHRGDYHGKDRKGWQAVCRDADLILNLSGGFAFWRDEYSRIPFSAFIDTDPGFTQLGLAAGSDERRAFFDPFKTLFTFGQNVGRAENVIPTLGRTWIPTYQPIFLEQWPSDIVPASNHFTTIMSWTIQSFKDVGGYKDAEFLKVIDLPKRTDAYMELAVNGPKTMLEDAGWHCIDAFSVSNSLQTYREYIQRSAAEFSVAKQTYVATHSGWFSDRTACYLASARPAIVQDTGFSEHLPAQEGLIAISSAEDAIAGIDSVRSNYAKHSRAAREIAAEFFSDRSVLPRLVDACG